MIVAVIYLLFVFCLKYSAFQSVVHLHKFTKYRFLSFHARITESESADGLDNLFSQISYITSVSYVP